MTREEAARVLKYLWIERDENAKLMQQLTKSFFERQEALRIGAAALRGPQPAPDTGLKGCLFCKAMDDYKALQIDPAFAYKYTVAIVSRLYKAGNPRARSTSTYYGNGKYVLNYCPMCGRKLEVEG